MRYIIIPLLTASLTGCLATVPVAPEKALITLTPDMVDECDSLKPYVGKTAEDLANLASEVIIAFNACDAKNHSKAELIKKFFKQK